LSGFDELFGSSRSFYHLLRGIAIWRNNALTHSKQLLRQPGRPIWRAKACRIKSEPEIARSVGVFWCIVKRLKRDAL
jgi:hypothetical protein